VNIQHLRHSLKVKWLLYYRQNRQWLVKLQIWEPMTVSVVLPLVSSTLSNLEPQLTLPFIVDLSNNPDQIVAAWVSISIDAELKSMTETNGVAQTNANGNGLSETSVADKR